MKTLRKLVEYFFIFSVRFACVIKSQILQHAQLATAPNRQITKPRHPRERRARVGALRRLAAHPPGCDDYTTTLRSHHSFLFSAESALASASIHPQFPLSPIAPQKLMSPSAAT
jgi:hypothetical protein